jgi:poly(3-hydroxybutyrate) depolymerase
MNAKRSMLSLAAVLAATVLTGGAAVAGLVHRSAPTPPAAPVTVVHQAPAPGPSQSWSEGGD